MKLPQNLHWLDALVVISGCYLIALFNTGGALSDIGAWSIVVWGAVVIVALMQAKLLYQLALQLPHHAGGTATYAHATFTGKSRILAFLSGWGYEIAWTPGIALNCLLIAQILLMMVPGLAFGTGMLAVMVMALLYSLNYFGAARVISSSYILALITSVPLLALIYIATQEVGMSQWQRVTDFSKPLSLALFFKWFFVISWTGYAIEMISSVVSELHDRESHTRKIFQVSAVISSVAFIGIPLLLALLVDWSVAADPFTALQPLFLSYFGPLGTMILQIFLIASLVFSALSFIVPSTRTVYQMAHDGLLPKIFGSVNRYGSPTGSFLFDLSINSVILLIFQDKLMELVATANIGYIVVFVILPFTYYLLHRSKSVRLSVSTQVTLVALFAINLVSLMYGGFQWGWLVFGVGWMLVGAGVPLFLLVNRTKMKSIRLTPSGEYVLNRLREMLPIARNISQSDLGTQKAYKSILDGYINDSLPPSDIPMHILAELEQKSLILLDHTKTQILGAYPFRTSGTPHRIIIGETIVGSMCAFDPLGTSHMIGRPIQIVSTCAVSGRPIKIYIDDLTLVSSFPHDVYLCMDWAGACCEIPAYGICEEAVYVIGKDQASEWRSKSDKREVYSLDEMVSCASAFFARQYRPID